jgi:AraC-like DNA-binding protein
MHGLIRLSDIARECGFSVSHFARSFKTSFGTSTHQWLIQHRIDHAKQLMSQTIMSLIDIVIQSGFNDQAAFTRICHQFVGVSPGRRRRHYMTSISVEITFSKRDRNEETCEKEGRNVCHNKPQRPQ